MKKLGEKAIWALFAILIVGNIAVFMNGVKLSDEINFYENEIKNIKQDNIKLEKKVYKADSVTYAASVAAELKFSNKNKTVSLDEMGYAYNN